MSVALNHFVNAKQGAEVTWARVSRTGSEQCEGSKCTEGNILKEDRNNGALTQVVGSDRSVIASNWHNEAARIRELGTMGKNGLVSMVVSVLTAIIKEITEVGTRNHDGGTDFLIDLRTCFSASTRLGDTRLETSGGTEVEASEDSFYRGVSMLEKVGQAVEAVLCEHIDEGGLVLAARRLVLVGYTDYVSLAQRLVVNSEGTEAEHSETSKRMITRLLPCCDHQQVTSTPAISEHMREELEVYRTLGKIQNYLRGVNCDQVRISESDLLLPRVLRAYIRGTWLAVREFNKLVMMLNKFREDKGKNFTEVSTLLNCEGEPLEGLERLSLFSCGVNPAEILRQAELSSAEQTGDVSLANDIVKEGWRAYTIPRIFDKIESTGIIEVVLYSVLITASTSGDLSLRYGSDVTPRSTMVTICEDNLTELAVQTRHREGQEEKMDWIGEVLVESANGADEADLHPIDVSETRPNRGLHHMAADTEDARTNIRDWRGTGLLRGECKQLPKELSEELKYSDGGSTRTMVRVGNELFSVKSRIWFKIKRSIQVSGITLSSPFFGIELNRTLRRTPHEVGAPLMNRALSGELGIEATMFILNLMFTGNFKVRCESGDANCYVPQRARSDTGYYVSSFLSPDVVSKLAFGTEGSTQYWLPRHGLPVFQVSRGKGRKVIHLRERSSTKSFRLMGRLTYRAKAGLGHEADALADIRAVLDRGTAEIFGGIEENGTECKASRRLKRRDAVYVCDFVKEMWGIDIERVQIEHTGDG